MNCLKNPQKFLWIKYNGEHHYKAIRVWKFMSCSDNFCVEFECSFCGAKKQRHFVEWDELLSWGIPNEKIKTVGTIELFQDTSLYLTYNIK